MTGLLKKKIVQANRFFSTAEGNAMAELRVAKSSNGQIRFGNWMRGLTCSQIGELTSAENRQRMLMTRLWRFFFGLMTCVTAQAITALPPPSVGEAMRNKKAFSGIVVDDAGSPLGNVQVHLQQRLETFYSTSAAFSDSEGSFTLHLIEGAQGVVYSNAKERVVDYAIVTEPPPSPVKLTLKQEGRMLAGTVVDEQGQPVPFALVGISANTREGAVGRNFFRLGLEGAGMKRVQADAGGKFQVEDLPALPIIVWAAQPNDYKGLDENYRLSAKKPLLDLGTGDIVDYQATVDPPPPDRFSVSGRAMELQTNPQ
jgi:hypothetical protein